MKKMNNKGFTLVEVLAVLVILSILMAIMIPSVTYLININKENNYNDLKNGLVQATKVLLSDYRYDVSIKGTCTSDNDELNISSVGEYNLTESKVPIQVLIKENNVTVTSSGDIENPKEEGKTLDLDKSYVLVKYQCKTKDFRYEIEENPENDYLVWK